jgi:predicted ATPase/class 3 adenylate cyclase
VTALPAKLNNVFISDRSRPLPSGNVTFLMSDIQGSTRLWETQAEAMRLAVQDLDELVLNAVSASDGVLLKERGEGDSHFAVFSEPTKAVQCAVHIQRLLAAYPWQTTTQLSSRMGIHSATAHPTGADYYGPDVNRCARIRGAGHGGQILISQPARDGIEATSEGWSLDDLGLHRLLDLSEPQRIFQVHADGLKDTFAPLKSLNAVKHNLPVQLTSFIGREKELEELRKLAANARLVTVLGPGGAGKTRIALQLAAESIEKVKGGVWFVDLSTLRDGSAIAQKVVEDLFIRAGADSSEDAVVAHFQGPSSILLLDNCEHLAKDAAVLVGHLLKQCPEIYVIATSREPLGLAGERAYRLPPMNLKVDKADTLEDIGELDSVRLLVDRARSRGYEEVLRQSKPAMILELCRKLDGIPLALEQAAANLGVLSPETMLARLDERLSVLRIDDEGVEARHRTLSAAIDWSYETLTDEERDLFLDLAVFVGGWNLQAAESICAKPNVLGLMQKLVSKSLVWPEATEHGDRRFRLLETMREYAMERRSPIPATLSERHLAYFSHLAKVADEAGLDAYGGRWARALDADHSNIIAALGRSLKAKDDSIEGLVLANSMFTYWHRRDFYRQGSMWLQMALDSAPNAPDELLADSLNGLGIFAIYQRKLEPARVAIEASLQLWTKLKNDSRVGATLNNLAWIALEQADRAGARDLFERAAALFDQTGDSPRLADALQNLGQLDWDEGDASRAIARTEQAVMLQRGSGDRFVLLRPLANLLGFYAETNGVSLKLDLIEEAISIAMEVGSMDLTASVLDVVAFAANEKGDARVAARLIGAASQMAGNLGIQLAKHTQQFRDRLSVQVQESLGRQAFKKESESGRKLSAVQALERAREFVDSL